MDPIQKTQQATGQKEDLVALEESQAFEVFKKQKAFLRHTEAAEQGDIFSQYALGIMLKEGQGCKPNLEQALSWYKQAATNGYLEAQFTLGSLLAEDGPCICFEQAVYWLNKAAERGHPQAQCNLGFMFEEGLGCQKNLEQAIFWYKKAKEQGLLEAKKALEHLQKNKESVTS